MTLPNAHLAVIEERKVTNYLLNGTHPDNGGSFFHGLGFSVEDVPGFIAALRHVAESGEVVERLESAYGEKFVVDGALSEQSGTAAEGTSGEWRRRDRSPRVQER